MDASESTCLAAFLRKLYNTTLSRKFHSFDSCFCNELIECEYRSFNLSGTT
jgi:hypothetical protein